MKLKKYYHLARHKNLIPADPLAPQPTLPPAELRPYKQIAVTPIALVQDVAPLDGAFATTE